jgi:hypothetical protein
LLLPPPLRLNPPLVGLVLLLATLKGVAWLEAFKNGLLDIGTGAEISILDYPRPMLEFNSNLIGGLVEPNCKVGALFWPITRG